MIKFSELNYVKQVYGLPEFVKEAELDFNDNQLKPQQYAYPEKKLFPIHNKTACYISNAQFWDKALLEDYPDRVAENLVKAAKFWNIFGHVRNIMEKTAKDFEALESDQFTDEDFALVTEEGRFYPVYDKQTVKAAAYNLYEDRQKLPFELRKQAAKAILNKLDEFNEFVEDEKIASYVEMAAGKGIASRSLLKQALSKRAYVLEKKFPQYKEALKKLSASLDNVPIDIEVCEKTASTIAAIDEDTGLYTKYSKELPSPEEACHVVTYDTAAKELDKYVKLPTGNIYKKADLDKFADKIFSVVPEAFGSKRPSHFNKLAFDSSASGMKQRHAIAVESVLDALNVEPVDLGVLNYFM